MLSRAFAGIFIVAWFSALPLWFLSTQVGWVTIACERHENALSCSVREVGLLGAQTASWMVRRASVEKHVKTSRGRSSSAMYQLVFDTPAGRVKALRAETGNADVKQAAAALNAALDGGAARVDAQIDPDGGFWAGVVLVGVFAGSGLLIFVTAGRPVRREEKPRAR